MRLALFRRAARFEILQLSGADSSGLTKAMQQISSGVYVRLSERQVIVQAVVFALAVL